ncbi:hypothetical protein [Pseudomonas sp. SHLB1]|uniref:hypothetical protein n=1 Tax=unclassified Pseudomonas TaxID=196821 RepID=UPI003FD12C78
MSLEMTHAELEKIHSEIAKLMAETSKLNAETNKLRVDIFWYPVAVATGLVSAVAGVTAIVIKLFN